MRQESLLDGSNLPDYEKLASYLFFTATGEEFAPGQVRRDRWFIGSSRLYDVYLIYDADVDTLKDMALTLDVARRLPRTKRSKLVFAPTKYVESELLHRHRITFQQLPSRSTKRSANHRAPAQAETRTPADSGTPTHDPEGVPEAHPRHRPGIPRRAGGVARQGFGGTGSRPRAGFRLGTQGVGEERSRPHLPSAQERTGRTAAVLLPQDSNRRRQDPARDEGGRSRQHALPEAADGACAVDRPHNANLQPDPQGLEGSRPSLPPATRHGVGRPDADAGEDQRIRPAGRPGEPVRAAADAAVGQPGDQGTAPNVPGQRRLRPLLPRGRRRGRPSAALGRGSEPRHLRAGGRLLGTACQDLPRQHPPSATAADHPRRRTQGVQPERQGDAGRIQSPA